MSTETLPVQSPAGESLPVSPVVPFNQKPRPKVYVAASAYDWKCDTHFANSLIVAREVCHSQIMFDWGSGDAAIGRKRNYQMWHFLKNTDADFIFFIDSDIIFQPVDIDRIVAHNLPIVGGIYPKKSLKLEGCYNAMPGALVDDRGLQDMRHAGNGFLCISRAAAQRIIDHFGPSIEYRGDPDPELRWDFFPFGAVNGAYKSEDWYFCERARSAGLSVKIDHNVKVLHIGKLVYPLAVTIQDADVLDVIVHKYHADEAKVKEFLKSLPIPAFAGEEKK